MTTTPNDIEQSDWEVVCDAIVEELIETLPEFADAEIHRYARWDPELLDAADGKRHVAVHPFEEGAEPLTTDAHMLNQVYAIVVWEPSPDDIEALTWTPAIERKVAEFTRLQNAIRRRIYRRSNQTLGGSYKFWYRGTEWPDAPAAVRAFRMLCSAEHGQEFYTDEEL